MFHIMEGGIGVRFQTKAICFLHIVQSSLMRWVRQGGLINVGDIRRAERQSVHPHTSIVEFKTYTSYFLRLHDVVVNYIRGRPSLHEDIKL
jgi:hypothetical protein